MKYTELSVKTPDGETAEILTALLGDYPFESFIEEDGVLKAYIPAAKLPAVRNEVAELVREHAGEPLFTEMEDRNWNELWESNFEPIEVEGRCLVRAPFHADDDHFEYRIEIMPKMSFGTGHHATTHLMVTEILECDFCGMDGLDMGSGTGILAILAAKMGANHVDAVDIDEWAYENGRENFEANGVAHKITPVIGDVSKIAGKTYDFILANINRNILLEDMGAYAASLRRGGTLTVSGILEADIPEIRRRAASAGLVFCSQRLRNGWALITFRKSA